MREMVYTRERKTPIPVLEVNSYRGYDYVVLNLGTHPTAYIRIPKEHPLFGKDDTKANELAGDIEPVYGWWTFSGNMPSAELDEPIKEGYYLGFDAGHIQDYQPSILADLYPGADFETYSGHRWTTEEMVDECKNGIDWLIEVQNESRKGE